MKEVDDSNLGVDLYTLRSESFANVQLSFGYKPPGLIADKRNSKRSCSNKEPYDDVVRRLRRAYFTRGLLSSV